MAYNGTIPTEFGRLTAVTILNLGQNSLTGTLPTEIGHMTSLLSGGDWGFVLSNSLDGSIPTELGNLVEMAKNLEVSNNAFSGTLPTELGNIDKMASSFSFDGNSFTVSYDRATIRSRKPCHAARPPTTTAPSRRLPLPPRAASAHAHFCSHSLHRQSHDRGACRPSSGV